MSEYYAKSLASLSRQGNNKVGSGIDISISYGIVKLECTTLLASVKVIFPEHSCENDGHLFFCKIHPIA